MSPVFDETQSESLVMLFIYLRKYGYAIALSVILLGVVIWQSHLYPRWLGVAIALVGIGSLILMTPADSPCE